MNGKKIERAGITAKVLGYGLVAASVVVGCSDNADTSGTGTGTGTSAGGASGTATGTGSGGHGGNIGSTAAGFSTGNGGSSSTGGPSDCDPACSATQVCTHGICVDQTMCKTNDDCENDTYCDKSTKACAPWSDLTPPNDAKCIDAAPVGVFAPKVKCEFNAAPTGDPFPGQVDVQGTPVVVNFNNPPSAGVPSIVAVFTTIIPGTWSSNVGVIRVLHGDDCTLETNLGGVDLDGDMKPDYIDASQTLAVGDLDGDGVAEIIAYGVDGSTYAFTKKSGTWSLLWKAPLPAGAPWTACGTTCGLGWAGPSIHDIDDDGKPEVIREGVVFNSDGSLKSMQPAGYTSYSQGLAPVLGKFKDDGLVYFTNGAKLWSWQGGAWVADTTYPGATSKPRVGFTAIADFGAYGSGPANAPEIAIVSASTVSIYALDGTPVMVDVPVPASGGGGPPTIGDFDGDGLPEVAVAAKGFYTVYDPDCGPNPRPGGTCNLGPCDYAGAGVQCTAGGNILWSRTSQDKSSDVTGSSLFDFEADGKAEVVYADECFTRVYNGQSGEVLFSQYRSSCTWYENPVVADTDGNFRADLVTPSNKACAPNGQDSIPCGMLDANGVDTLFAGLHCKANSDCTSGTCDNGLCRCTATADCCAAKDDAACLEVGFKCAPPPTGTLGTGNTCRAAHPHGVSGIRVYSDSNDQWVRSRTIWNQSAYSVNNVNEDGTIPKTSDWKNNWDDPTLNNFRENVPGDPNGKAISDSTAGATLFSTCNGATANLTIDICNRGAAPLGAGLPVGFYVDGTKVCSTKTTTAIAAGDCASVVCPWATAPSSAATEVDVDVVADDGGTIKECNPDNDKGLIQAVFCIPPS